MEHARKMVLVPQEIAHQVQTNHYHAQQPTYHGLNGLDEEMQTILKRKDIPEDERVKLYQQALLNYVNLHQRLKHPLAIQVETQGATQDESTKSVSWISKVVDTVPKILRKKAEQLMLLIEQAPPNLLRFNEKGELVIGGKVIEGTHAVDLMNDILRSRKNFTPTGWQIFANSLSKINPPQELIGNIDRWRYMQGRRQRVLSTPESSLDGSIVEEEKPDEKTLHAKATHLPKRKVKKTRKVKNDRWSPY